MPTIFSRIVAGAIPCHKIAENDEFLAFLDISPLKLGHTLIIPKIEVDYIFDIEDDLLGRMMIFAKMISKAIKASYPCNRVGVAVIGLEVPHAHIHLVPINQMKDIDFHQPKLSLSKEQLADSATLIRQNLG
jgi:histidine triad (HIT) family protein